MDSQKFLARIHRLHLIQGVTITFNKDGVSGLRRIVGLSRHAGGPRFADHHNSIAHAVAISGDWGMDANRSILIYRMDSIDDATLEAIAKDVEKVETSKHLFSGLMTGRVKRQQEVADELIRNILNEDITNEAKSWGASIEGALVEVGTLPAIEFTITNDSDNKVIARLTVDGWSGRFAIDHNWSNWNDRIFSSEQSVRQRIYSVLTDALDAITQTAGSL